MCVAVKDESAVQESHQPQLEQCGLAAQGGCFFVCSVFLLRLDVSQIENFKFSQIVRGLFLAAGLFLLTNT